MFALYDCANQGLSLAPDDEHLRYLQSLALARLCEPAAALALYQRNRGAQIGTEVTLAARIEPRVPVGSIYVTQPFAAMIDKNAAAGLSFEYVGNLKLAKNYGSRVIYRLIKSEVASVPKD